MTLLTLPFSQVFPVHLPYLGEDWVGAGYVSDLVGVTCAYQARQ